MRCDRRDRDAPRPGARWAAALVLGLAASGCAASAPAPPAQPPGPEAARPERVILVSIDTLRADYVGCYGGRARTPILDGLAARGVRFATAVAPTPITLPSHGSLLTGLDPPRHGVHTNSKFRLPDDVPTLAEQFRAGGFATAAFVGAVVLDARYGLDRGFDAYDDRMGFRRNIRGATGGYAERRADAVVDAARDWLDTAPQRFFLWVHFYDPHANYDPPRGFRPEPGPPPTPDVGPVERAALLAPPLYAGEIHFADTELGRLLRLVERRFPDGRTLVAVTSDHGESLGEHGELTHTLTLYDATQHVPLVMAGPGLPAGRVVDAPVRLVDVAPTLLAAVGLPPLPDASGVDLSPWIGAERDDPLDAYVETLETHLGYGWSPVLGVRTGRHKYLRSPRPELYDLARDPMELRNLAESDAATAAELDAALEARLTGARPVRPDLAPEADEVALLESLGYVVPASRAEAPPLGWVGGPDPKDAIPIFVKLLEARSALAAARPEAAREALDGVTEAAGGWIAHARSRIALELGEWAEAERQARLAIAAQPLEAEGYLALGAALETSGRPDAARAAYAEALRLDPAETDARVGLGRLAEAAGEVEAALAHYRHAIDSPAPNVDAALRLAALLYERGDAAAARDALAGAGGGAGGGTPALLRLSRAEAAAGHPSDALARLEEALRLPGADAEALDAAAAEIRAEAEP